MSRRKKRGGHDEGHENAERWLLTYADMITLLMVLFVVMYAVSTTDLSKFTALAQSFSTAFNTDVFLGQQVYSVNGSQGSAPGNAMFDASSDVVAADYRSVEASIRDFAVIQGLGGEVSVERVPEGIAIRLSEGLLFLSGRAALTESSWAVIRRVSKIVVPLPNELRVEGHTDDLPPSGPFYENNWELSTARALAVLSALETLGVAPDRLGAAGYAGYHPLVPNTDDASRARNRRVDLLILYPQAATPAESSAAGQPASTNSGGH